MFQIFSFHIPNFKNQLFLLYDINERNWKKSKKKKKKEKLALVKRCKEKEENSLNESDEF